MTAQARQADLQQAGLRISRAVAARCADERHQHHAKEISAALGQAYANARQRWRDAEVSPERFVEAVLAQVDGDDLMPERLQRRHLEDLLLAAACLDRCAGAIAVLQHAFLPQLDAKLRRLRLSPDEIGEAKQKLMVRLVYGEGRSKPALHNYNGSGPLLSWMKIVCLRTAMRRMDRNREVPVAQPALEQALGAETDPQWVHVKTLARSEFKAAFRTALAELTARQRTLLRQRYLDGASIGGLAELHRVHRATINRWLSQAKVELLNRTRAALTNQLDLAPSQCDSYLRLADSTFDITLSVLYGDASDVPSE